MGRHAGSVRVVSLVPSATETLLALGVTPIAVTRFCERPELPAVGGTKDPDIAAIVALEPDVVILCEEENRREDADALAFAGVATCALVVDSVADAAFAVGALAAFASPVGETGSGTAEDGAPGLSAPGGSGGARMVGVPPPLLSSGVRAFIPIWRRPWMTMSAITYGSSMLEHLGIANIFAGDEVRYPTTDLDAVKALAPDVVLAPSEPYPFKERHVAELSTVAPVELIDGQDLFWWGIRTPDALERLRRRLEPWVGTVAP